MQQFLGIMLQVEIVDAFITHRFFSLENIYCSSMRRQCAVPQGVAYFHARDLPTHPFLDVYIYGKPNLARTKASLIEGRRGWENGPPTNRMTGPRVLYGVLPWAREMTYL